jgi:hypothetical protein
VEDEVRVTIHGIAEDGKGAGVHVTLENALESTLNDRWDTLFRQSLYNQFLTQFGEPPVNVAVLYD